MAALEETIAGLEREAIQFEKKKHGSIETASRKRAALEKQAGSQASSSGKILRIDRRPEGEKILLSVLYQERTR